MMEILPLLYNLLFILEGNDKSILDLVASRLSTHTGGGGSMNVGMDDHMDVDDCVESVLSAMELHEELRPRTIVLRLESQQCTEEIFNSLKVQAGLYGYLLKHLKMA